tara:strand:+ start:19017 stop:19745 length:729 start_codon:yes stop_codon:yes gene_type:complete
MISKEEAFLLYKQETSFLNDQKSKKTQLIEDFDFEDFIKTKQSSFLKLEYFINSMLELQRNISESIEICNKEQGCYEQSIKTILTNSLFLIANLNKNKKDLYVFYSNFFKKQDQDYENKIKECEIKLMKLNKKAIENKNQIKNIKYKKLRLNDGSSIFNQNKRMDLFFKYRNALEKLSLFYNEKNKDNVMYKLSVNHSIFLIEEIQRSMGVNKNTVPVRQNKIKLKLIELYLKYNSKLKELS